MDDFYCSEYFNNKPESSLTTEINKYTKSKIKEAVDAVNVWISKQSNNKKCCQKDCVSKSGSYKKLYAAINKRLGSGDITIIEKDIRDKFKSKICLPKEGQSICTGVETAGFGLNGRFVKWMDKISTQFFGDSIRLGESIHMCGQTIGTDKLGHFFDSGHQMISYRSREGSNIDYAITNTLQAQEGGKYGVSTTGIYSFADYTANIYGQRFYLNLIGPNKLIQCDDSSGVIKYKFKPQKFDWCNYIHEGWNESMNCSAYSFKQISKIQENKAKRGYRCPPDINVCQKIKNKMRIDFSLSKSAENKLINCDEPRLTTIELKFLDKYRKDN